MKILVDTNVILDLILSREPNFKAARKIFDLLYQEEVEAFTTTSSVTDIYYITAKKIGDKLARNALRYLFNVLTIIAVNGFDCIFALDLPITDYEDAVVVTCANKVDIDYIITNDKTFSRVGLEFARVVTADDFLKLLGKD